MSLLYMEVYKIKSILTDSHNTTSIHYFITFYNNYNNNNNNILEL